MERDPLDATDAERAIKAVLVLQTAKLALDGRAAPVETSEAASLTGDF